MKKDYNYENYQNYNKFREDAMRLIKNRKVEDPEQLYNQMEKLLEALNVHQIELEMQNKQLSNATDILASEREKYRELYNNTPVAYFTLNRTGNIMQLNYKAQKLLGVSENSTPGISIFPFLAPTSKTTFVKYLKSAFDDDVAEFGEIEFVARNNKKVVTLIQASVYYDIDAEQRMCRLTATDITEQKRTQHELHNREKKFSAIFNNVNDAVGLTKLREDGIGRFVEVNRKACEIFGYTRNEILALKPEHLFDEGMVDKLPELMSEVKKKGFEAIETMQKRKDGTLFPAEVSALIFEMNDELYMSTVTRDITRRKEAEEKIKTKNASLKESNDQLNAQTEELLQITESLDKTNKELNNAKKRYELLSNLTFEGIVIHRRGIAIDVNISFAKIFGYTVKEIIGQNLIDLIIHPQDKEIIAKNIRRRYAKPYEVRGITRFKSVIPIEIEAYDTIYDGNEMRVAAVRNITERKNYLKKIKESEQKIRSIINNFPNGSINLFNKVKKFEVCGGKYYQKFNVNPESFIGKKPDEVMSEKMAKRTNESLDKALKGESLQYEINYGGHLFMNFVNPISINDDNTIDYVLLISKDISEQRQNENKIKNTNKQLRDLNELLIYEKEKAQHYLDIANVMFIALNNDGIITLANKKTVEILEAPENEIIGKEWFDAFIPIENKNEIKKVFAKVVSGDVVGVEKFENYIVTKTGKRKLIEWRNTVLHNEKHQIIGLLSSGLDITEANAAQKALIESENQLKELNATKDKFFSIIAHDLKSPFNSIVGFADLLLKNINKYDIDKITRFTGIIRETAINTHKLLNNLLYWSRAQTGSMDYNIAPQSVNELLLNEVDAQLHSAEKKDIRIVNNLNKTLFVNADRSSIETVIRNLISNAIKFTHAGGTIYTNAVDIETEGGSFVQISIEDTGVGIENTVIDKLFKIDQNVSTQGTNKEAGTGLGLILCKEFVEKNNGNIWVESTQGEGSTFYFTLPQTNNPIK